MKLYLDTSVLIPLFVPERQSDVVVRWLGEQEGPLYLADLAVTEFHAVVSRLIRKGAIDPSRAEQIRAQFEVWATEATESLENIPADIRTAGRLVRQPTPRLLSADATHLATCARLELGLATFDKDLQAIAEREGVRPLAPE